MGQDWPSGKAQGIIETDARYDTVEILFNYRQRDGC